MSNNTDFLIRQTEDRHTKIDVKLEDRTVWMTQKAIAELFQTSPQNITIHIKKILTTLDSENCSKYYTVLNKEGSRSVKRKILHYNLDVIFNIAIRGQYILKNLII